MDVRFPAAAIFTWIAGMVCGQGTAKFQPPDPRDLIIYQVITDRFDDGDPSNNTASPRGNYNPTNGGAIHGGDFKGLTRRLDYIRALGANGIWISPFLENTGGQYHGYSTYDWYKVDPHFGTEAELIEMISEAHKRGIAVYFDVIANHCGNIIQNHGTYLPPPDTYTLQWNNNNFTYPPPFNSLDYFHAHGAINDFNQPEEVLGELSGLDDLKTETAYVRTNMISIWKHWMERTDCDGFRVDTVKHVDLGFWQAWSPPIHDYALNTLGKQNFFIFGEVFNGSDGFCNDYVGTIGGGGYAMDGILDFRQYYLTTDVFARGTGSTSGLTSRLTSKPTNYGANFDRIPTWLDSHDQERFLHTVTGAADTAEAHNRLKVASTFNFTVYGPPILYYGTEQGFDGGGDPNDREDMFDGGFEQGPSLGDNFVYTTQLYQHFQQLLRAREAFEPLRRGTFHSYSHTTGAGQYIFARRFSGQEVLVILNSDDTQKTSPAFTTTFPQGTELVDVLNPAAPVIVVGSGGSVGPLTVPGYARQIRVPSDVALPKAPSVISVTPTQGSIVPTSTTVVVTFDQIMDHGSVAGGFSLSVANGSQVEGTGSWSGDDKQFTFTPAAPLLGSTSYTVSLSALAAGANGARITNPPLVTFTTAREARTAIVPPSTGVVYQLETAPAIDGVDGDWPVATPLPAANTARIDSETLFEYVDALDDDSGDGDYLYPTNGAFTSGDADLAEFRFAHDAANFYFYFRPKSVNPGAAFFTPYYGVVGRVEEWTNHLVTSPGVRVTGGETGRSEIDLSILPFDFEVVYAGNSGARFYLQNIAQTAPVGDHSAATGIMEISVPKPSGLPDVFHLVLFPYAGLETFSDLREIEAQRGDYEPGGSNVDPESPDVFDLAGAPLVGDQIADLNDYQVGGLETRPVHSYLHLTVAQRDIPVPVDGVAWFLF